MDGRQRQASNKSTNLTCRNHEQASFSLAVPGSLGGGRAFLFAAAATSGTRDEDSIVPNRDSPIRPLVISSLCNYHIVSSARLHAAHWKRVASPTSCPPPSRACSGR